MQRMSRFVCNNKVKIDKCCYNDCDIGNIDTRYFLDAFFWNNEFIIVSLRMLQNLYFIDSLAFKKRKV